MRRSLATVLSALALAAPLTLPRPASAAGPNGGQTAVADGHPVEFVAADREVTFFVTGHDGKPQDTAKATGKAYVSAGGQTETLTLTPAAPNRLVATLSAPLAPGAKVVFTARLHGHSLQARFER